MTDHISHMLDSMITAVDQGLSYDGIVSMPETGLEDISLESRLAEALRDGVDRIRNATISRGAGRAAKVLKRHLVSNGGVREKNHNDPVSSDEPYDDFSDVQDELKSLTNERNRFAQSNRSPNLVNEMPDVAYSSCLLRPQFNRGHSAGEPISEKLECTLRPVEEEWEVMIITHRH